MSNQLKIVIADDHPLFRDALASAISGLDFEISLELAEDFESAMRLLEDRTLVDILLLDLNMPGSKGLSGLSHSRSSYPAIPVIVVSAIDDPAVIRRSLALGAAGYIVKSSSMEEIRDSIHQVLKGEVCLPKGIDLSGEENLEEVELLKKMQSLTPQQNRVLGMLGEGLLNKQIAYQLDVSEATVKAHVSAILLKLGVDSRTQAVISLTKISYPSSL